MLSSFLRIWTYHTVILLLAVVATQAADPECTNPSIRKEWRTLSTAERTEWISAVKCLANLPHNSSLSPTVDISVSAIPSVNASGSFYDDIVYIHMDLNTRIHFTGLFLPWHRYYVNSYEIKLRELCGFTGASPYWNWASDASDVFGSTMFQDNDTSSGLGGWGDQANDVQVPGGGFADGFTLSYPSYHHLRRNFTLEPYLSFAGSDFFPDPSQMVNTSFTQSEVDKMVTGFAGDYKGFQKYFEGFEGAHGGVHEIMGGDLGGQCPANAPSNCTAGPTWSANEPLFWMHHAMVDKVWYDWQNYNESNFWAYEGGSVQSIENITAYEEYPNGAPPALTFNSSLPTDGIFYNGTIYQVMNTTGGYLCYKYE